MNIQFGEFVRWEDVEILLGELVSRITKDPRNISGSEWKIIDPIYQALEYEQWEGVLTVAKSRSGNISQGPGECSRSSKRQQREIHKALNSTGDN